MKYIYNSLPSFFQDGIVSLVGLKLKSGRFNKNFHGLLKGYIERDFLSKDEMLELRRKQLRRVLEQASETVYYAKVFNDLGAHWSELCEPEEFSKIPLTYKSDVAKNPAAFMSRRSRYGDYTVSTSGTTGQSLSFRASRNFDSEQWAVWWRYRMRFGIRFGTKCALFASAPIVSTNESNRFWRCNLPLNEYRFSIFHISESTVESYVDSLNKIRAPWIHGNPSAIALLAQLMLRQGLKLNYSVSWVTIGSENILPWQTDSIFSVFGVKPIQHYGLAEGVSNISQCPQGMLHTDEDFAFTEYLKLDSSAEHMIVGTAFHNEAFSLIRYVTGDKATLSGNNIECGCGRKGRVVQSLDGRLTDYITIPGGEKVASLAAPLHSTHGLAEAQIYQDSAGALTVRYVPTLGWKDGDTSLIEKKLRERIGNEITIKFQKVEKVERSPRGKIKLVISDYQPGSSSPES